VPSNSLEAKIQQAGGALRLLRGNRAGAYPFPIPPEHTNWRDEQESWHNTAVLFDQSFHMTDITFKGPDALRLMSDLGVNSFRTFGRNKAKQFIACDEHGRLIGEAVLFGLQEDELSLVGTPTVPHWVAFHAYEAGRTVSYIQSLSTPAARFPISPEGGYAPLWSRDGEKLSYVHGDRNSVMAVDVRLRPAVAFGDPVVLVPETAQGLAIAQRGYDITPNGRQLVVGISQPKEPRAREIHVIMNWTEELKRLAPRR